MPFSILALDLDGTLLTDDLRITERSHAAIRRAREHGVTVLLASARPPRSMLRYHRALELDLGFAHSRLTNGGFLRIVPEAASECFGGDLHFTATNVRKEPV